MKKLLENLNKVELEKVFKTNSKLRDDVFDDMSESANFFVGEILRNFDLTAISYDLDVSGYYNYIRVKDRESFAESLVETNSMYGVLDEDSTRQLNRVIHLIEHFNYIEDTLSDVNYTRLDDRIDEIIDILKNNLYKFIRDEYDAIYDDDNQLNYFLDFYVSERMSDDDYYIDDDYKLYQHVEYEKCYA